MSITVACNLCTSVCAKYNSNAKPDIYTSLRCSMYPTKEDLGRVVVILPHPSVVAHVGNCASSRWVWLEGAADQVNGACRGAPQMHFQANEVSFLQIKREWWAAFRRTARNVVWKAHGRPALVHLPEHVRGVIADEREVAGEHHVEHCGQRPHICCRPAIRPAGQRCEQHPGYMRLGVNQRQNALQVAPARKRTRVSRPSQVRRTQVCRRTS